jgi:CheY-like chemotaxis protein
VYARAEELLCYSILANLLKNAIEATPRGGIVRVGIEPASRCACACATRARAEAVSGRFFDKYVTAGKSGGTGLGTYSARLMARVQDGELEMQTGPSGTVLTLSCARWAASAAGPPRRRARRPRCRRRCAGDSPPRRVLLVDDDEYNRLLLLRYLPSPPFTVETAPNGQAAIEAVGAMARTSC